MFKNNKRGYVRLPAHHLIKYRVLEKERVFSYAKDISAGGLRFHCKESIPVGSIVEIMINFPGLAEPVKVLAKITWQKSLQKGSGFEAGARFVNIDEKARSFINDSILKFFKGKREE